VVRIKRALLSVSDKTGITELANVLQELGCEIISTGGTKKNLEAAGISVTDITSVTKNPEAFDGRMKTISFNIESALLFDREKDKEEATELSIEPIDMVVCNLYPFSKVKEAGAELPELIENIDIGGPTMIRAGAKNYKYVAVVTDINDYGKIIKELKENGGALSLNTRFKLMRKTFNHTADYDALIATTMDDEAGIRSLRFHYTDGKQLRYGENSHQEGYFYRCAFSPDSLADMKVLHGKEISYNNLSDIQSAIESVKALQDHGCSIIKHNNPCGLAQGKDQRHVFERAWSGDPISAFGSIIAFNQKVNKETVEFLQMDDPDKKQRKFVEVVIAPEFTEDARHYLFQHKNLRVIEFDPQKCSSLFDMKKLTGSLLLQDADSKLYDKLESVTELEFDTIAELDLIEFGIKAMKLVRSNSIVIVRKTENSECQLLGMGAGQPNRLISTRLAIDKAIENLTREYEGDDLQKHISDEFSRVILVSDAFFPFADNVELAGDAGIARIIQPGGSMRDKSVIRKCNELGIAMLFTGVRHFKH
jgi:phosphoribosylaminoimidazolecarboxamide formyltransferase / IMP cyclohydrolase